LFGQAGRTTGAFYKYPPLFNKESEQMKTPIRLLLQVIVILALIAGSLSLGLQTATAATNLALNRPVTCSPTPQYPCAQAVDGNAGTRWASAQGVDPQWIYVDLGATTAITSEIGRASCRERVY
jgi:hypothetical protein